MSVNRWGGSYTDVAGLHGAALDADYRQRVSRPSIAFSSLPAAGGAPAGNKLECDFVVIVISNT